MFLKASLPKTYAWFNASDQQRFPGHHPTPCFLFPLSFKTFPTPSSSYQSILSGSLSNRMQSPPSLPPRRFLSLSGSLFIHTCRTNDFSFVPMECKKYSLPPPQDAGTSGLPPLENPLVKDFKSSPCQPQLPSSSRHSLTPPRILSLSLSFSHLEL